MSNVLTWTDDSAEFSPADWEAFQRSLAPVDSVASLAVAAERERCARIAESVSGAWEHCGAQIAATIRSGECLSQNGSAQAARCLYCGILLGGGIDDHTEGCPWAAEQMRKMKNSVPSYDGGLRNRIR